MNPPISPPKNPAPWLAIYPATAPGINPGLSAILIAINPARTGIKKWKAPAPTPFNNLNNSFCPINLSTINEIASKIPPPITNGSILETPFIILLYIILPIESFS